MSRPFVLMTAACLSAATLFAGATGAAEVFPNRPIRIVTTDVGNSNDLLSRLLAESLTPVLGQQVVVENRGGAGGGIAAERLMSALPDGHTIMVHGTSIWLLPLLRKGLSWDPLKSFAPISLISRNPAILLVPANLPPKSTRELIDYAKARPGQLNYVSVDDGSPSHLAAELFTSMAGIKVVRVAYKGGAAAFNGLMAGEGQMMVNAIASSMPHVRAGRLRGLAVTSPSTLVSEFPTIAESVPGYEWITHQVILAPLKTPPHIIKRLNAEAVRAINGAEMKGKAMKFGAEVRSSTPEEVTAMMKAQMTQMAKVLKASSVGAQ